MRRTARPGNWVVNKLTVPFEVIRQREPWRITLEWMDSFNRRHLLELIGKIPLSEAEARYHAQTEDVGMAA
ncbi:hypothetical protein TSA6c_26075 [Azospirillum sp. TSA6c]|nr:hypothetical protein TSA6c_26075 [Azospirillum sp. TSA6c]